MSALEFRQSACIALTHPCLPGHFPGQPVVPGVLMLDTVMAAAQAHWPGLRFAGVPSAKFLRPALPDQAFELVLRRHDQRLDFDCGDDNGLLCRGQLSLRDA